MTSTGRFKLLFFLFFETVRLAQSPIVLKGFEGTIAR